MASTFREAVEAWRGREKSLLVDGGWHTGTVVELGEFALLLVRGSGKPSPEHPADYSCWLRYEAISGWAPSASETEAAAVSRQIVLDASALHPATLDESSPEFALIRAIMKAASEARVTVVYFPTGAARSIVVEPLPEVTNG